MSERRHEGLAGIVGAIGVAVGVLVYAVSLRRFGLDLADEGTLLAHFAAVARGDVPYRDFQTGYGPLGYYWHAALLTWLGHDVVGVRLAQAFVHAASAFLLALVGGRIGGPWVGITTVVVVWGMLRPVAPGAFATFNIPYPSWLAEGFGYAAVMLMVGRSQPSSVRLFAVGILWALAFLAKQNAGLLGLGGTIVVLALEDASGDARPRWIGWLLAGGLTGATVLLLAAGGSGVGDVVALAVPVWIVAVAVARARPSRAFVRRLVPPLAGFGVVAGTVLVALGACVGGPTLLRETLQLGTGAAARFRLPYPTPFALLIDGVTGSESVLDAVRRLADDAWLLVLPVVSIYGALRLALRSEEVPRERRAVIVVGVMLYLQLYPRADLWHVLPAAGLLIAYGLSTLREQAGKQASALIGAVMCVAFARSAPTVGVLAAMATPEAPGPTVPHASLRWDVLRPAHLTAIPAVAATVEGTASLFGFPALGFFNFVTDAKNPSWHQYFFPGHPDARGESEVLRTLTAKPPDAIVLLDAPVAFFPEAFTSHRPLVSWLRSAAWQATSIPPYVVGRRVERP